MYAVKEGHVELLKECFDMVEHGVKTKVCVFISVDTVYAEM